jgi:hypothetical protein
MEFVNQWFQKCKNFLKKSKYMECLERIESIDTRIATIENRYLERIESIDTRIATIENRYNAIGFDYLRGRLDFRLIRLEMVLYYKDKSKFYSLTEEQKHILNYLENGYFTDRYFSDRFYPLDDTSAIETTSFRSQNRFEEKSGIFGITYNGVFIYLAPNINDARSIWNGIEHQESEGSPHIYIDGKDGFEFPEDAIVCDIGGAEGFFTAKYLTRIRKAYIFEPTEYWLNMLRKTFNPYGPKIEIVKGICGNAPDQINLDDFFKDREKPNFIKIDVEGMEVSVLKGMKAILGDSSNRNLKIAVCAYHRQEDEERIKATMGNGWTFTHSSGFYWHMPDPTPPFFRRGVIRASKIMS